MFAPITNENQTIKNAKELLQHFDEWRTKANLIMSNVIGVKSPTFSDMPVSKSRQNTREYKVIKSISKSNDYQTLCNEMINALTKMQNKSDQHSKMVNLINCRYIQKMTIKDTCDHINGITTNSYKRLHDKAMYEFAMNYHRLELLDVSYS